MPTSSTPRNMFTVNGRFKSHRVTGMQRYATETCARFESNPEILHPKTPLTGIKGHFWEQAVLPTLVKPGLLWSPCNTGPLLSRSHVITIHDLIPLDHPEWFSKEFSTLYQSLMPALIRRAEHIIAVSEYTKQRIISLLGTRENKITMIPNGVDEKFKPQPQSEIERVKTSLGIPAGPYFLSVCSLEPRKNIASLIAAWSSFKERSGDATLVLAGAKGSLSVFKSANLGAIPERVVFTGYVPDQDLPALYSGACAFVYPSLYEGFGLPVLEALATGTRVIASNTTSIPEIASPSTVLISPTSTHEIVEAMQKMLDLPENQTPDLIGRQHAQGYTWDRCARATETLLLSYS